MHTDSTGISQKRSMTKSPALSAASTIKSEASIARSAASPPTSAIASRASGAKWEAKK